MDQPQQIAQDYSNLYPSSYWQTKVTDKIHLIQLPNKDLGGLYLGGLEGASDNKLLHRYNIRTVLTTAAKCPISFHSVPQITFHHVIPVHMESEMYRYFERSNEFIDQALPFGNILIQCISGTERAPLFAMAYLMKKQKLTVEQSLEIVELHCPFAHPNSNLMRELLNYERSLNVYKESHYTFRDNERVNQFSHLMKPQNSKAPLDKHQKFMEINVLDIAEQIDQQSKWLREFRK